jgi:hypothetical protein
MTQFLVRRLHKVLSSMNYHASHVFWVQSQLRRHYYDIPPTVRANGRAPFGDAGYQVEVITVVVALADQRW